MAFGTSDKSEPGLIQGIAYGREALSCKGWQSVLIDIAVMLLAELLKAWLKSYLASGSLPPEQMPHEFAAGELEEMPSMTAEAAWRLSK